MENSATSAEAQEEMAIRVVLNEYLKQLNGVEAAKLPSQRRTVPTLSELAKITGQHRVTLTNLANNNIKLLNLATLSIVLNELRRRGFETSVSDLLTAYPVAEVKGKE
ncbi:MAG: hypothetical protein ACPGWR_33665 [Ardenticatenaceae bacterium]